MQKYNYFLFTDEIRKVSSVAVIIFLSLFRQAL